MGKGSCSTGIAKPSYLAQVTSDPACTEVTQCRSTQHGTPQSTHHSSRELELVTAVISSQLLRDHVGPSSPTLYTLTCVANQTATNLLLETVSLTGWELAKTRLAGQ